MEEVEDHMNEDTLKEIRQEYRTLRVKPNSLSLVQGFKIFPPERVQ